MPEITALHIAILTVAVVVGVATGWVMRGNRSAQEKTAVSAGWQEQIEAQRSEHDRLQGQNRNLMEQVSQFQASGKDANNRAKELSTALKEAFARRDELQREIKDVRNALQSAGGERDKLRADAASHSDSDNAVDVALQRRDEKIFKLSRELENWQDRLPPLIERFTTRNEEANQLEAELEEAHARIEALEGILGSDQTRVDPVDQNKLGNGLDASNDSNDDAEELLAENEILDENDDVEKEPEEEEPAFAAINDVETITARDDLKQIKGIGPAIEKTLNELGIFTLEQIAQMSEYDIDRVAKRLKGFRSRIYREDWIGQARGLQGPQSSEHA